MAECDVVGVLLAAGAGRRIGGPKALRDDPDGTSWLVRSTRVLLDGGCSRVLVVLGAGALEAEPLVRGLDRVETTWAPDWADGMGSSLRHALSTLAEEAGDEDGPVEDAALVHLVDLPDVGPAVVARVLQAWAGGSDALVRAAYDGIPGHPVLLGSDHWREVSDRATGDRGARDHLADHEVVVVECGDLATGVDVDTRPPS